MKPETEEDLAEAIRVASAPLSVRGGGTRGLVAGGEPLETTALSGIRLYEPGALTMVAGAGTPLAEIRGALEAERQMLAFEPYDLAGVTGSGGSSTIGGVFATNASGPRRVQAGAARDFLLGVRFVDGSGNIVKNGGRVMKNVTGYDLVKLMAGSHGTLGVLTEVSFKVLPMPETSSLLVANGLGMDEAIGAMTKALGSPYDVTAAMHDPIAARTTVRVEGFAASVAYRLSGLARLLSPFGNWEETDPQDPLIDLPRLAGKADLWRISCAPSASAGLAARLDGARMLLDWAGGRIWAATDPGTDLRAKLGCFDGHATLIKGGGQPRFHPEPAPVARLAAGLRARFDPRNILNPGLMG